MKIFYFLSLKKVIYRLSAKSILHSETFSKKRISSYPNSHLFLHIQTKLKLHKNWHELSEQLRAYIQQRSLHRFTWGLKIRTSKRARFFVPLPVLYTEPDVSFSPATISIMECPSCSLRSSWLASRRTSERGTS